VNDVDHQCASLSFFLDYIANRKLSPEANGRSGGRDSETAAKAKAVWRLLGGETAETAGLLCPWPLDLAGFWVAVVEAGRALNRRKAGGGRDAILAWPAAGS